MIGITGGIASGKSQVAQRLKFHGAVVLDTDLYSREAILPQTLAWRKIKEAFPTVIESDLTVNRRLLGEIVFNDAVKRRLLEKIIHPEVLERVQNEAKLAEKAGFIVFVEVPLLYEVSWDRFMDQVWVIYVDPKVQLERLMERDQMTRAQAERRIASQMSLDEKRKRATKVIDNNGSLTKTLNQVDVLWKELERDYSVDRPR